jgi:hypothetical protein
MVNNNHRWRDPSDESASGDNEPDPRVTLFERRVDVARQLAGWLLAMRIAAGQVALQQAKLRRIDNELRSLDG